MYKRQVGDGWWAPNLRAAATELGVGDHVTFHGHVDETAKHAVLARSQVHLMPSRTEGWGLAVIEAAQHGVPTVGYRSSAGLQDSVVDGVTGLLADTPAGLVEAVGSIVADPELRAFLGAEAKKRAETFSWDATARAVEQVLSDVAVKR